MSAELTPEASDAASRVGSVMATLMQELMSFMPTANYAIIGLAAPNGDRYEVTVRPEDGKTPHEMRIKAEAERDEARSLARELVDALELAQTEMERRDGAGTCPLELVDAIAKAKERAYFEVKSSTTENHGEAANNARRMKK
jgi:hypothetical protein